MMATYTKDLGLLDVFPFGKHNGEAVVEVMDADLEYLSWCIESGAFHFNNEAYSEIMKRAE